jgi:ubiquinone/menaquinone biosynthesis C-methylase UbiE
VAEPRPGLDVAGAYDAWAAVYDTDANRTRDQAGAVLRRAPLDLAGRRVLEIGCGTGANTEWLAERSASVVGLDFSGEMLRRAEARVRSGSVRFVEHDLRSAWPLPDSSVEVVIAVLVLEHVESLLPVFAESARVLGSGGELFLCELHPMRQLAGQQAEFVHPKTREPVKVTAFMHETSEYVNAGLAVGFEVTHLGEWREPESPRTGPPRLLSVCFRLRRAR